uniref:hypothetical protein n=1 Tax=Alistipes sp. TaxID=1872444 RepID=UPI004055D0CE
ASDFLHIAPEWAVRQSTAHPSPISVGTKSAYLKSKKVRGVLWYILHLHIAPEWAVRPSTAQPSPISVGTKSAYLKSKKVREVEWQILHLPIVFSHPLIANY